MDTLPAYSAVGSLAPLRVLVVLDRGGLRQWQLDLLARLGSSAGVPPAVEFVDGANRLPGATSLLFTFEQLIYGTPESRRAAPVSPAVFETFAGTATPDLVLDLSGREAPPDASPWRWTLTFDGAEGDAGLLDVLLRQTLPLVEVRQGDRVVAQGEVGTEYQGSIGAAYDDCIARSITLIAKAIAGARSGQMTFRAAEPVIAKRASPGLGRSAATLMKRLPRIIALRLYRLCFYSPQWRVGWRRVGPEGDVFDLRRHPDQGWTTIADDGRRFYADPFPIEREGRSFLFVEDYVHRIGKGIISVAALGPNGAAGPFEPVLETPFHLSYPFVLEHDGEVYMVPESQAAGTIDLYRATQFPRGWVKEATLVSDVAASDATLHYRDDRWWLFATVRDGGGSFSDALYLWSSRDLAGPFRAHAANPVLVDCAAARPAGRIVQRNGVLWRPVQDCRERYGGALGIAKIDRLDDEGYAQTVETVLRAGNPQWEGRRIHTLNRAGDLEFIDGSAAPPRRFFPR